MSGENNPLLNTSNVSYQTLNEDDEASDRLSHPPDDSTFERDVITPMHRVYVHEITDVPVGSYEGLGDRSVLLPPPGIEDLEREFQEAVQREIEENEPQIEARSIGSAHNSQEAGGNNDVLSERLPRTLSGSMPRQTFKFGYDDPSTVNVANAPCLSSSLSNSKSKRFGSTSDLRHNSLSQSHSHGQLSRVSIDSDAPTLTHTRPAGALFAASDFHAEQEEEDLEEDEIERNRPRGGGDATTIYPGQDPNTEKGLVKTGQSNSCSRDIINSSNSLNHLDANLSTPPGSFMPRRDSIHTTDASLDPYRALLKRGQKLGEWRATAICGNDATGSIFYMAGPCVTRAGVLAPLSVFIVTVVLYVFRSIYGEAVTALPLNGGAYNILLNTTKKSTAAMAAVLTLLSYVATAVVSAAEAIHYLRRIVPFDNTVLLWGTIGVLFVFAMLNYIGIGESANVALAIFMTHLATLSLLLAVSLIALFNRGTARAKESWHNAPYGSIAEGIYYGFASAMLGVTGFETSANYVEEQKPGVYVKTLRNMWVLVSFFNITLSFCVVFLVDVSKNLNPHTASTIVADLAKNAGGRWLEVVVSVDACLVLAGGVLTAYVGVTGLVRRLAMDRCLPEFFLKRNKLRGTNHWIIFCFFFLCASMYIILNQNVQSLADTYSVAFMAVMALFALGVMMLKVKRSTLTAEVSASWLGSFLGFVIVIGGLFGIVVQRPSIVYVFALYFFAAWAVICVMFFRYQVLKLFYNLTKLFPCDCCSSKDGPIRRWIRDTMYEIRDRPMAFFAKQGKISVLNKAIQYVRENEDCSWLRIIHIFEREQDIPPTLYRNVHILNEQYPKMKIDLVLVKGKFTPAMVAYISVKLGISRNHLFITTPQPGFTHKLEDLGGVRLVTH